MINYDNPDLGALIDTVNSMGEGDFCHPYRVIAWCALWQAMDRNPAAVYGLSSVWHVGPADGMELDRFALWYQGSALTIAPRDLMLACGREALGRFISTHTGAATTLKPPTVHHTGGIKWGDAVTQMRRLMDAMGISGLSPMQYLMGVPFDREDSQWPIIPQ